MEQRLELVTSVRSESVDPERELFHHIVEKGNSISLVMPAIDLEGLHPGCVVDRRVLEAADSMTVRALEAQNLHVCLNVMARDLLSVAVGMDSSAPCVSWKVPDSIPYKRSVDTCT
jgi:hypothetical protein